MTLRLACADAKRAAVMQAPAPAAAPAAAFAVRELSPFHLNRSASLLGRSYVDAHQLGMDDALSPSTVRGVQGSACRTNEHHLVDDGRRGLPGGPGSSLDRTGGSS